MDNEQLSTALEEIAERCGTERNQQAVKSILLTILAAMAIHREIELMHHVSEFARSILQAARARSN